MAETLEAVKKETEIRLLNMEKTLSSIDKIINGITAKLENINLLEYRVGELNEKHNKLAQELHNKHATIDARITVMEQKPVKRWESLVSHIITLVAGGAVTYFFTLIKNK